jgi:hypothetical protein
MQIPVQNERSWSQENSLASPGIFVRKATGKASGLRPAFFKETLEKSRSIYLRNVQEPVSLVGIPPMALDEVLDSIGVHPDSGTPITDGLPMGLF